MTNEKGKLIGDIENLKAFLEKSRQDHQEKITKEDNRDFTIEHISGLHTGYRDSFGLVANWLEEIIERNS